MRSAGQVFAFFSAALLFAAPALAQDSTPPTVTDVRADGVLLPDATLGFAPSQIVVTFNEDIDPATVSTDTFRLVRSGGDGTFDDGNEVEIVADSVALTSPSLVEMDLTSATVEADVYRAIAGVDRRLEAYWRLDETGGLAAADSSGNGNDGNLVNGPVWTGGAINGALSFDGVDDSVDCGDIDAMDGATQLTATAWVKATDLSSDGAILSRSPYTTNAVFNMWRDESGAITGRSDTFTVMLSDGTNAGKLEGASDACSDTDWHHVAVTFRGNSAAGLRLYVDGTEDPNSPVSTATVAALQHTDYEVRLGAAVGGGRQLNGVLDDVRIYSRALDGSEILALSGSAPTSGVTDASGNPLDGEFTGSFPSGDGTPGGDFVCTFEITAPAVLITSPADGATDVPVGAAIDVTFSRAMDQTATEAAFLVSGGVKGSVSWTGNTLVFTPDAPLDYESYYTATVTADARDATGVPLADAHTFAFTTVPEPKPGGGEGGLCTAEDRGSPFARLALLFLFALAVAARSRRAARAPGDHA